MVSIGSVALSSKCLLIVIQITHLYLGGRQAQPRPMASVEAALGPVPGRVQAWSRKFGEKAIFRHPGLATSLRIV